MAVELCHLLRLPAELRIKVYNLVLAGSRYHIKSNKESNPVSSRPISLKSMQCYFLPFRGHPYHTQCYDVKQPVNVSLLRTCRIIHDEASLILYSGNTFMFYHDTMGYEAFMKNRTSSQFQAIQSLHIIHEGSRFNHRKRIDLWHYLCTTMASMTNLKDLKLGLYFVRISNPPAVPTVRGASAYLLFQDPFDASGANVWQWTDRAYDPSLSPFSLADGWITALLCVRGLKTFELDYYAIDLPAGRSKWIDPFVDKVTEKMLGITA